MNISRTKFVIFFLFFAFAFLFIANSLLEPSDPRLFPSHGQSFLRSESPVTWKNVVSIILLPIKIVLIGPLLPYIEFLRQEPDTPPPFFLIGFIIYWTILASILHFLLGKLKRSREMRG